MYIELHTASAFSFLQGASLPETLVDRAAELGYPALALLDRDGVYGLPRFHKAAVAAGIRPIVGAELSIADGDMAGMAGRAGRVGERGEEGQVGGPDEPRRREDDRDLTRPPGLPGLSRPPLLSVLCETQEGYRNLCRLITLMKLRAPKGAGALALAELEGRTSGLVALVGRAALDARRFGVGGLLDRLIGLFGRDRVYVDLQRHYRRDEASDVQALVQMAAAFRVPTIATNGVRFAQPSVRPLFDVLTCIRQHTTLTRAGRALMPNAERYLKPPEDMTALFAD